MNLLTTGDVAERLSISAGTVRSLVRSGDLTAVKIGSEYRIDEEDLSAFIQKNRTRKEE
jgi:excisionase family DNA binding protein